MLNSKLMNSLLTKKAIKINGLFDQSAVSSSLFAVVLLSLSSANAYANRPAMEDAGMAPAAEQSTELDEAEAITPEAPSAVEIMMQQQATQQTTRQTGTIVQLPAKEIQPGETIKIKLLDYPRRGMSMDKVQNEFGQPIATSGPVGEPPITHWTYSDRVVYFEYSTVLHVVAR